MLLGFYLSDQFHSGHIRIMLGNILRLLTQASLLGTLNLWSHPQTWNTDHPLTVPLNTTLVS